MKFGRKLLGCTHFNTLKAFSYSAQDSSSLAGNSTIYFCIKMEHRCSGGLRGEIDGVGGDEDFSQKWKGHQATEESFESSRGITIRPARATAAACLHLNYDSCYSPTFIASNKIISTACMRAAPREFSPGLATELWKNGPICNNDSKAHYIKTFMNLIQLNCSAGCENERARAPVQSNALRSHRRRKYLRARPHFCCEVSAQPETPDATSVRSELVHAG